MNETTRPTRFLDARATRLDTETMAYAGYAPGHRVIERTPLEEALLEIGDAETLDVLERLARNVARSPSEEKRLFQQRFR